MAISRESLKDSMHIRGGREVIDRQTARRIQRKKKWGKEGLERNVSRVYLQSVKKRNVIDKDGR